MPPAPHLHLATSRPFAARYARALAAQLAAVALALAAPPLRSALEDALAAVQLQLLHGARAIAWWSAISLLASSCCALQVVLAALSFGCSGINSVLGPVRPVTLASATIAQSFSWYVAVAKPWMIPTVAGNFIVFVLISFLPEILDWRTRRRAAAARAAAKDAPKLAVDVGGVGCAACAQAAMAAGEAVDGVAAFEVDVDTGRGTARLAPGANRRTAGRALVRALRDAGYEASTDCDNTKVSARELKSAAHAPVAGAVIGGLLGSSCCIVQLAINAVQAAGLGLGIGCAGFNKWLGPHRPFWRSVTAVYVTWMIARASHRGRRAVAFALATAALTAALTFLPELLLWLGGVSVAPPAAGATAITFDVVGMGCEACQNAVAAALANAPGALSATADFKAGTATVVANPDWGFDLAAVSEKLAYDGYELAARGAPTYSVS